MTLKEHLDFLKRISQKVANWPAWRRNGIVPEEKWNSDRLTALIEKSKDDLEKFETSLKNIGILVREKPLAEDFVSSGKEYVGWQPPSADGIGPSVEAKMSEEFKTVLEEARENLEIIRTTGRPHDQDMWCSHCHKILPCRFRPYLEAGPYWRCSECGEVIGE